MKIYKKKSKNIFYLFYRLINPIIDPVKLYFGIFGYFWYFRDLIIFKIKSPKSKIPLSSLYPMFHDKTNLTPFDAHYFYQQLWVFNKVLIRKPKSHFDFGSSYQLAGYLSQITPTIFADIRPIQTNLKNLKVIDADLTNLKLKSNSIESASCLHVIEHIGLGRYGDKLDPNGHLRAIEEIKRVLKPGGRLYLSTPIGKEKICFNAHRIFSPTKIINMFHPLAIKRFSIVTDEGKYIKNSNPKIYSHQNYACGLFEFEK